MKTDFTSDCFTQTDHSPSKKRDKTTDIGTFRPDSKVSDWLSALSAPEISECPNSDWKTREEVELLIGRKRFATQQYLVKAIQKGTVEMKRFRVTRSDGSKHSTPHYRIIG
jgi:hypothetical protein